MLASPMRAPAPRDAAGRAFGVRLGSAISASSSDSANDASRSGSYISSLTSLPLSDAAAREKEVGAARRRDLRRPVSSTGIDSSSSSTPPSAASSAWIKGSFSITLVPRRCGSAFASSSCWTSSCSSPVTPSELSTRGNASTDKRKLSATKLPPSAAASVSQAASYAAAIRARNEVICSLIAAARMVEVRARRYIRRLVSQYSRFQAPRLHSVASFRALHLPSPPKLQRTMATPWRETKGFSFHSVCLHVRDVQESAMFYQEIFGTHCMGRDIGLTTRYGHCARGRARVCTHIAKNDELTRTVGL